MVLIIQGLGPVVGTRNLMKAEYDRDYSCFRDRNVAG